MTLGGSALPSASAHDAMRDRSNHRVPPSSKSDTGDPARAARSVVPASADARHWTLVFVSMSEPASTCGTPFVPPPRRVVFAMLVQTFLLPHPCSDDGVSLGDAEPRPCCETSSSGACRGAPRGTSSSICAGRSGTSRESHGAGVGLRRDLLVAGRWSAAVLMPGWEGFLPAVERQISFMSGGWDGCGSKRPRGCATGSTARSGRRSADEPDESSRHRCSVVG